MSTMCPVLFDINRSFKRQNTISLKTGVLIKVSEMRRLQQFQIFLAGKVLLRATKGARNPNLNAAFTNACVAVV